ncbi:hypothetical protein THOG05_50252 [Vibrio rotiferianus]|nr:hypothetical protein THOG05_50252 [Vibrio rotiferianus]CAH1558647.1 hypothetical protein THOE12_20004 [Vibrio rotiferianus]
MVILHTKVECRIPIYLQTMALQNDRNMPSQIESVIKSL